MAKTFKQSPAAGAAVVPRRISERDFFDLTDAAPAAPTDPPAALEAAPDAEAPAVRQTFVLSRQHLEQLRDYVHAQRALGHYSYSQRQALQEALDMLFASAPQAPPRPLHAREREQQHRRRIRQGRQPNQP